MAKMTFQKMYPNGANDSNYTSIITENHFLRLRNYLTDAKNKGCRIESLSTESISTTTRTLVPHFVINPPADSAMMTEEIFGPVLPVITYGDFNETKKFLHKNPNPLALYLFTNDSDIIRDFELNTSSGGLCINDFVIHFSAEQLPFGGVRQSGIGQYHGLEGYQTFTRPRAILKRGPFSLASVVRAPYQSALLKGFYRIFGIKNT
jgi:coniferyl-aldehyde dehydrogenase